jgi:hypothetical protein
MRFRNSTILNLIAIFGLSPKFQADFVQSATKFNIQLFANRSVF